MAKLISIAGVMLVVAVVLVGAWLLVGSLSRNEKGGSPGGKVPVPPAVSSPNLSHEQYLGGFYSVFKWFLESIRITMKEIVREHLICRAAMRHHRDTLLTLKEKAEEKSEEFAKWASAGDGDWAKYRDLFKEAVRDLDGVVEPLSRWLGRAGALMLQAAGQLYRITDKLSGPYAQLRRMRRGMRGGGSRDEEQPPGDSGDQQHEENGDEAEG